MNRPIRRVALVIAIMFALLLGNLTLTTVVRHQQLHSSPYNGRVHDAEFTQNRGPILAGTLAIAKSKASNDRFEYQRSYPQGSVYASVTGYFAYNYGATALERSYSSQLAGTSDSQWMQRLIDQMSGKEPKGASVETTIVPKIQEAAVNAMGKNKGAIVALDPQTGAILALLTTPTFDPNQLATHDFAAASEAATNLEKDPNVPLTNRAVREIYPPGSTFKLVTVAAALEAGKKPETLVATPSELTLPQTTNTLGNQDSRCGNTQQSIDRALQLSCNTTFANLGLELGESKLAEQASKFGFGQSFLPELSGVSSQFPSNMSNAQVMMSAIGQYDVNSTPLQMAMIAGAIANNGTLMKPYLVKSVKGPNLETIEETEPSKLSQAMSADNAKLLQQMMRNVVTKGSGTLAQVPGVATGGKTGTAEHGDSKNPYGWYVAYGPSQNPRIAVAVFVEESVGYTSDAQLHAGYSIASPIAQKVLAASLG
ncbi:MAG: peptidoglycan D,D-transpeptidase FtsI family protein [Propionibacteriaceae bacterium]